MDKSNDSLLQKAMEGDINAFQQLFADFQAPLKSYLYRLLANRNDAEDLTHDTFIRAYDKLSLFKGTSSLKTWVFQIATNLAWNLLKKRKRWTEDVAAQAKTLVIHDAELAGKLVHLTETSPDTVYDIKEHIDTCFSCIGKNLPIENQIAVILKDVYTFSIKEIALIIDKTEGVVKYLLQDGRHTMQNIFTRRCALINKEGVCHQCSELNGWFNPKQDQQEALMKLDLVKGSRKYKRDELYALRVKLVQEIDPLHSKGHVLQEALMNCNRMAMGETEKIY